MRVAWATDIHLDCVEEPRLDGFVAALRDANPDCLLLGGDIALARSARDFLGRVSATLDRPVHFVLGNHDYYGSSIAAVRAAMSRCCRSTRHLHWLNEAGVVRLSAATALVGHDGWADGRLGDYAGSDVELNDYHVIGEFKGRGKARRLELLHRLGDEAAAHLARVVPEALARHRRVVVLTHVPPFEEACRYKDAPAHEHWLPHFTSRAAGEVLLKAMRDRPDRELIVLCGHTHTGCEIDMAPNLRVIVGGAEYGAPTVQRVFEWD